MKNQGKKTLRAVLPFFLTLGIITILAWILPLRPTVSEREKRTLEPFPSFSWASLGDGSYFASIGVWFSDTFPFRDAWIDAGQAIDSLHGHSEYAIYGDVHEPAATAEPTPAAVPAATPAPAAVPAGEALTPEPSPTEDPELAAAREMEEIYSIGAVLQVGDAVYELGKTDPAKLERYAGVVNKAAEQLAGRCRVFNVFFLNSTTILLPDAFKEKIGVHSQEILAETLHDALSENVTDVETVQTMKDHKDEYIFFRTDHHWTALGAYYAYANWAEAAGFEPVSLDAYTEQIFEPFYGSLFYQANQSSALTPDQVYAYTPPGDLKLYVCEEYGETPSYRGIEQPVLEDVVGTDKYMAFLRGDHALTTFINNDIEDDSAVVLIKNSNGNPFSYYLTQHYRYVYVLDYRKYATRSLQAFCELYDVDDVIFLMSSSQIQGGKVIDLIDHLVR